MSLDTRQLERILKVLESAIDREHVNGDSIILMAASPYVPDITADDIIEARAELEELKIPEAESKEVGVEQITCAVTGLLAEPVASV